MNWYKILKTIALLILISVVLACFAYLFFGWFMVVLITGGVFGLGFIKEILDKK